MAIDFKQIRQILRIIGTLCLVLCIITKLAKLDDELSAYFLLASAICFALILGYSFLYFFKNVYFKK